MSPIVTTDRDLVVKVTNQMITDQIVTAIEGGCNYWMESFHANKGRERATESPWYSDPKVWGGDFEIECSDGDDTSILTPDKIKSGLQWLAEHHLWRLEQIVKENGDAETADVFLQACLFGEIVYG